MNYQKDLDIIRELAFEEFHEVHDNYLKLITTIIQTSYDVAEAIVKECLLFLFKKMLKLIQFQVILINARKNDFHLDFNKRSKS